LKHLRAFTAVLLSAVLLLPLTEEPKSSEPTVPASRVPSTGAAVRLGYFNYKPTANYGSMTPALQS
jgi:hypothetical protein